MLYDLREPRSAKIVRVSEHAYWPEDLAIRLVVNAIFQRYIDSVILALADANIVKIACARAAQRIS